MLSRMRPERSAVHSIAYTLPMVEFQKPLHSQLPPSRLWGYAGQYPGPVLEAQCGQMTQIRWENRLPATHLFQVDPHIHGAMPPTPKVRTVPHLHGAKTDSISDGLPEKWFTPGTSVLYRYPNQQRAAALWYHDHAVGITRLNVYAGLAGFYLLRSPEEQAMGMPAGDYEVPLMLQDRLLDKHGQVVYQPSDPSGEKLPPGVWGPQIFGNLPVVNGAIYPYLEVEPRLYRFRLLNAANSRFFHLYLNGANRPTDIPALLDFHQVGSDGGLLQQPAQINKLLLAPGERADLIVDFSGLAGKTLTLSNDASTPYPAWGMMQSMQIPIDELMQFRVTRPLAATGRAFSLPPAQPLPSPEEKEASVTRDFILTEKMSDQGRSMGMSINGKGYDDPVTEVVQLGALERWRFINTTDDAHPMHLHLVQFRIVKRQGFDMTAIQAGEVKLVGMPRAPEPNEAGWKDTAIVNPRDLLEILVRFEGFTGRYVFHCHLLEHEDNDMMRPYEVIAGNAPPDAARRDAPKV